MNDVASDAHTRLRPLALPALFALDIKPRGMVLDPIIPEKGLVMLYAVRGTGKTHVALGIAYAVATGGSFLKWQAPQPRRVLLVDGEMPASALRERLHGIAAAGGEAPDLLEVLAGDLVDGGIGNLAVPEVQAELDPLLAGVDLLILDNLASLTAVHRDDAVSWTPIQEWLLRLRRRGLSVLIVHHAGKSGDQRGTSRREDVLDTSINLRHSSDYEPGRRREVRGAYREVPRHPGRAGAAVRGATRDPRGQGGVDHAHDRGRRGAARGGVVQFRNVAPRHRRRDRHLQVVRASPHAENARGGGAGQCEWERWDGISAAGAMVSGVCPAVPVPGPGDAGRRLALARRSRSAPSPLLGRGLG